MDKSWLKKILSDDYADDVKRLAFLVLVVVHIVSLFLIMYIKIEIANKDIVINILDWNSWLIIATGGLVGLEPVLAKWKPGGPKNVVQQDIQQQTVNADETTINK